MRHTRVFFCLTLLSCNVSLKLDESTEVTCESNEECPTGYVCSTSIERCRLTSEINTLPPAIAGVPTVNPSVLRQGSTTTVTFEVSERLARPPVVTLDADQPRSLLLDESASSNFEWVFTYTAAGDEPQGVAFPISVDLVDEDGVAANGLVAGTLSLDFVAPSLTNSVLRGSPTNTSVLTLDLEVSETLGQIPVVALSTGEAFDLTTTAVGADYSLEYTPSGTEAEGMATVTVVLTDPAGNVSPTLEIEGAEFDRTPAALVGGVAVLPDVVREGGVITVTFSSSEPLGNEPAVDLNGAPLALSERVGTLYTFTKVAELSDGEGSLPLSIELIDLAGNSSGPLAGPAVNLDFTEPSVSDLFTCVDDATTAPCMDEVGVFSSQSGFDAAKISFSLSEPAEVDLTVGGQDVPCSSSDGLAHVCPLSVTDSMGGTDPRIEVVQVVVLSRDDAGNIGFEFTSLTHDFEPPALSGVPFFERCDNYTNARDASNILWVPSVSDISAVSCPYTASSGCGVDGPVRVNFITNEAVTIVGGGIYADGAVALAVDSCPGDVQTQWAAIYEMDAAEGDVTIRADVSDAYGNTSTLDLGTLRVDLSGPPPLDTLADDTIVYERHPWGTEATAGRTAFFVTGSAGTAVANAEVVAYDTPDLALATELGRTVAGGDGSFGGLPDSVNAFEVESGDVPEIFVAQEDRAGNSSEPRLVWEGQWIATPGQKARGVDTINPNLLTEHPAFLSTRDPTERREPLTPHVVGTEAAGSVSTAAGPSFDRRASFPSLPAARGYCAVDYSARDGSAVLFGGGYRAGSFGEITFNDTWEWNGRSWREVFPLTKPNPRERHSLVYDHVRERYVLFGGCAGDGCSIDLADTWEFDGNTWERLCFAGCVQGVNCSCSTSPSARQHHAAYFDRVNGVVTIYGGELDGSTLSDMWSWDGADWSTESVSPNPGSVTRAKTARNPTSNEVVMLADSGTLWTWSGEAWSSVTPATTTLAPSSYDFFYSDGAFRAYTGFGSLLFTWTGTDWSGPAFPTHEVVNSTSNSQSFLCGFHDTALDRYFRFGGCADAGCNSPADTLYLFDPVGPTLRQAFPEAAPSARAAWGADYDLNTDRAVFFGGRDSIDEPFEQTHTFDGYSWSVDAEGRDDQRQTEDLQIAYLGSDRLVSLLGAASTLATYVYFDGTWSTLVPGQLPITTQLDAQNQALAYDPSLDEALYYRGTASGVETWTVTWTGSNVSWAQHNVSPQPPSIDGHQMAYCGSSGGIVLFGGGSGSTLLDQTWLWDGSQWQNLNPANAPTARKDSTLYCDTTRDLLYLFGGDDGSTYLNDVWVFDGSDWREVFPAVVPDARSLTASAFMEDQGFTVMAGGFDGSFFDDAWVITSGSDLRVAHVFAARFEESGVFGQSQVESVSSHWVAGGRSYNASSLQVNGARIYLWDGGRWRSYSQNSGTLGAPADLLWSTTSTSEWTGYSPSVRDARIGRLFTGDRGEISFGVATRNRSRDVSAGAELNTSYAEIEVRYRLACLPSGSSSLNAQRCCSGTQTGGACD